MLLTALAMVMSACSGSTTEDTVDSTEAPGTTAAQGTDTTEASAERQSLIVWARPGSPGWEDVIAAFEQEFNTDVTLVERAPDEYDTAIQLAVTSDEEVDVLVTAYGHRLMGPLIQAGALAPLNDYADQYGWWDRVGPFARTLSFGDDGVRFAGDTLYAMEVVGAGMGLFYNKDQLADLGVDPPETFEDLQAALPIIRDAGLTPIATGTQAFGVLNNLHGFVANQFADPSEVDDWVLSPETTSYIADHNVRGAEILREWNEAGYLTDGHEGIDPTGIVPNFTSGDGVFMVNGTWVITPVIEGFGDESRVGFTMLEGAVTASYNNPIGIAASSTKKDLAAQFIDFVTGPAAASIYFENGLVVDAELLGGAELPAEGTLSRDAYDEWAEMVANNRAVHWQSNGVVGLIPEMGAAMQEQMAGRISADEFVQRVQAFTDDWLATR